MSEYEESQTADTAPIEPAPSAEPQPVPATEPVAAVEPVTVAEPAAPSGSATNRWLVIGVSAVVGLLVLGGVFAAGAAVGGRLGGRPDGRGALTAQAQGGQGYGEGQPGQMSPDGPMGGRGHGRGDFDGERDFDGDGRGRGQGHGGRSMPTTQGVVPQAQ